MAVRRVSLAPERRPQPSQAPEWCELISLGSQEPEPGNGDGLAGDAARLGQSRKSTWEAHMDGCHL